MRLIAVHIILQILFWIPDPMKPYNLARMYNIAVESK